MNEYKLLKIGGDRLNVFQLTPYIATSLFSIFTLLKVMIC